MRNPTTLYEDNNLKITCLLGDSRQVILCFTGVGHGLGGIDVQSEEFLRLSTYSTTIFIIDKGRTWGNEIDFDRIKSAIAQFDLCEKIVAVGNSMGGFLAILAAKFIDMVTVIAFVPQYSVHKDIVPHDNRWDAYTNLISNWRHKSLDGCFMDRTKYYIVAAYLGEDIHHLDLIPSMPNIEKLYFRNPNMSHNMAETLKFEGRLYDVIGAGLSHWSSSRIASAYLNDEKFGLILQH